MSEQRKNEQRHVITEIMAKQRRQLHHLQHATTATADKLGTAQSVLEEEQHQLQQLLIKVGGK